MRKIRQHRLVLGIIIGLVIVGALTRFYLGPVLNRRPRQRMLMLPFQRIPLPWRLRRARPGDRAGHNCRVRRFRLSRVLGMAQLGILDQLRAKYGDQIRFVWRDFPVITLLSPKAAEAGQCAHEQGKFWEFHDLVYNHDGAIEAVI